MHESTIAVQGVGVDWITATAHSEPNRSGLLRLGVNWLMNDAQRGNRVTPYRMARYYGGHTKHYGVAEWQGRVLVAVGGADAHDVYEQVLAFAENVSRIDLQVSVRQEPYDADMALRVWGENRADRRIEGRPSQYDLYARRGSGSTLYIGDGSSRYLARLYERYPKTHQEEDLHVWRYEVEAKRERAKQAADMLLEDPDKDGFIYGYVRQHFAARGVVPIFPPDRPVDVPPLTVEPPDKARSLAWLRSSVRPAIERLEQWGAAREAWDALGLPTNDVDEQDNCPGDFPHP